MKPHFVVLASIISIFVSTHALAQSNQKDRNYPLKAGTVFRVRLNIELNSRAARIGDNFTTTVVDAVYSDNGIQLVPAGSTVLGRVTSVQRSAKRLAGSIEVSFYLLKLTNGNSVVLNGKLVPVGGTAGVIIGGPGGETKTTLNSGASGKDVVVKVGTELGVSLRTKISLPKY